MSSIENRFGWTYEQFRSYKSINNIISYIHKRYLFLDKIKSSYMADGWSVYDEYNPEIQDTVYYKTEDSVYIDKGQIIQEMRFWNQLFNGLSPGTVFFQNYYNNKPKVVMRKTINSAFNDDVLVTASFEMASYLGGRDFLRYFDDDMLRVIGERIHAFKDWEETDSDGIRLGETPYLNIEIFFSTERNPEYPAGDDKPERTMYTVNFPNPLTTSFDSMYSGLARRHIGNVFFNGRVDDYCVINGVAYKDYSLVESTATTPPLDKPFSMAATRFKTNILSIPFSASGHTISVVNTYDGPYGGSFEFVYDLPEVFYDYTVDLDFS